MMNWVPAGETHTRRWSVVAVAACALAVTMLTVGGAAALLSEEQQQRDRHAVDRGTPVVPVLPAIVTEDATLTSGDLPSGDVDKLLGESRARSAETVRAGEAVYAAAAERSVPADVLRRLRDALDETSRILDGELPDGASDRERERVLRQLESGRAAVLDAAAAITSVRRVPAGELVSATTTLVVPDDESPGGAPVFEPNPEPSDPPEPDPSDDPSDDTSEDPTPEPGTDPSDEPSDGTSQDPSQEPTSDPSHEPSDDPAGEPTEKLSPSPSDDGSSPSGSPTD